MRRALGAAAVALCVLLTAGHVSAKPASKSRVATKSSKRSKSTKLTKKGKAAKTAKTPAQRDVQAVVKWLQAHIEQAKRSGKPSDLPTQLLAGLFQLSIPNLVHGQYALAGVGQALRTGGMPQADVQVVARDMERNFAGLNKIFEGLAAKPALKGQIAGFFTALAGVSVKGQAAATAMGKYASDPNNQGGASAFEQALEGYRSAIRDLMGRIK